MRSPAEASFCNQTFMIHNPSGGVPMEIGVGSWDYVVHGKGRCSRRLCKQVLSTVNRKMLG